MNLNSVCPVIGSWLFSPWAYLIKPLTFSTSCTLRAPESRGAGTVSQMVGHFTFWWVIAWIFDWARIFAKFIDACSVWRTIGIGTTFDRRTSHVGVAFKSYRACADGFVSDSGTFGVPATGQAVRAADGRAVATAAGVAFFAFAVRLAANLEVNKIEMPVMIFVSFCMECMSSNSLVFLVVDVIALLLSTRHFEGTTAAPIHQYWARSECH